MNESKTKQIFSPQVEGYKKHLKKFEGFGNTSANIFSRQIQDFVESGKTPKEFFSSVFGKDEKAGETFLMNFRHFIQYQQNQYFHEFHQLRWELGRKHKKGGF